jgi:hypothetical protein
LIAAIAQQPDSDAEDDSRRRALPTRRGRVVGVPIAIWRVLKTENAVRETEIHLGHYQILTLMPQLIRIEALLDTSVQRGDRDEAIRGLVDWKTAANRLRGFMAETHPDSTFDKLLRTSISQASAAKQNLLRTPTPNLRGATEGVRVSVGAVTDYSGNLEARLMSNARPNRTRRRS